MPFSDTISKFRKLGRKAVLPTHRIKKIIKEFVPGLENGIIDLGAGTLYWSNWFIREYSNTVLAVDTYYASGKKIFCGENGGG